MISKMSGKDFKPITEVINIREYNGSYIYIGRGSIFGNPFEIGKDGDREYVIKRYRRWFNFYFLIILLKKSC